MTINAPCPKRVVLDGNFWHFCGLRGREDGGLNGHMRREAKGALGGVEGR